MLPTKIKLWIEENINEGVVNITPVAGGCINDAYQLDLNSNKQLFVKVNNRCLMFEAEALGLSKINQALNMTPKVIAFCDNALLLEYLKPAPINRDYWIQLAYNLSQLHRKSYPQFGFEIDNYCGETPQPNPLIDCGFDFFENQRLNYQGRLAFDNGLLSKSQLSRLEHLSNRLPQLLPKQPAVLIHGDLWSGNCMSTTTGAKLIDPACYYGWAEAELAMTCLFGGFDPVFYATYESASTINIDWKERVDIYNLYHLLNHLNLFGQGYLGAVLKIVERYS